MLRVSREINPTARRHSLPPAMSPEPFFLQGAACWLRGGVGWSGQTSPQIIKGWRPPRG